MNYFTLSSVSIDMKQEELNDKAFWKKLSAIGLHVKESRELGLVCEYSGISEDMAIEMFEDVYWKHFHPKVIRF